MASPFDDAKALFLEGLAHLGAGRHAAAEDSFVASLALLPHRVSSWVNLAATRLKLSRPLDALAAADEALALAPDDADAWLHKSTALAQLGRLDEALAGTDRLLELEAHPAAAWSQRGSLLREAGRPADAAHAFRSAIAHGADAQLHTYYLAAVGVGAMPATPPAHYVASLFDAYATDFERHLVEVLHYRGHEVLLRELQRLGDFGRSRFESALDLGCGTGLCGPLAKPLARRLTGVDLSARMLEQAASLQVYDRLVQADLLAHLQATPERHDLVLAADVFIYIGELRGVFAAVHAVMPAGGLFGFSVEPAAEGSAGVELLPSLRYAHAEPYLRALAEQHGFDVAGMTTAPIRDDQQQPVNALFATLVKR